MGHRESLRRTFDNAAELYDAARPAYPAKLYDDLAELAGAGPDCRVLELGAGTGKASVALADRGCTLTAVELGPELARVARRNLAPYPKAEVVVSEFETWSLPASRFDLVLAATAFHWLDPDVRLEKSADALRPGGALAIVSTTHVAGGSAEFFVDVQRCYEHWDPTTPPNLRLPKANEVSPKHDELDQSARFGSVESRRYEWSRSYTTQEFVDLLMTYSPNLAMPPDQSSGLMQCIARLIDEKYAGTIIKAYLTQLHLAYRI